MADPKPDEAQEGRPESQGALEKGDRGEKPPARSGRARKAREDAAASARAIHEASYPPVTRGSQAVDPALATTSERGLNETREAEHGTGHACPAPGGAGPGAAGSETRRHVAPGQRTGEGAASALARGSEAGTIETIDVGNEPTSGERGTLRHAPIELEELDRADLRANELQAAGLKHVEEVIAGLVGRCAKKADENKQIAERVRRLAGRFGLQLLYKGAPAYFVWNKDAYEARTTDSSREYLGGDVNFLPLTVRAKGGASDKEQLGPPTQTLDTASVQGASKKRPRTSRE